MTAHKIQTSSALLETVMGRRRLIRLVLQITADTWLEPTPEEYALLHRFVLGDLSLDELLSRLEHQLAEGQLTALATTE